VSALAVVQARMTSTRLPGKSLADVGGEPLAALVLRRLGRASSVERVVLATSEEPADDPLVALAAEVGVGVHRGPRDDVLTRIAGAAAGHTGPVVRITADCPLIDPGVVDNVVGLFARTPGCAYASNVEPRTYPDGMDVEVIAGDALAAADAEATDPFEREHVTTAIRRDPDRFPAAALVHEGEDLGDVRWTVDHPEDLEVVREIVARLGDRRHDAGLDEILAAVRREPSLVHVHDQWGRRG
jgi:spore coat polysaccharide biosynthesis protein SpsF